MDRLVFKVIHLPPKPMVHITNVSMQYTVLCLHFHVLNHLIYGPLAATNVIHFKKMQDNCTFLLVWFNNYFVHIYEYILFSKQVKIKHQTCDTYIILDFHPILIAFFNLVPPVQIEKESHN